MANRDNHYEAAFEEYLRRRGVPYVAVDEAKRSVLSDGGSIKSLDFIVSTPGPLTWLVDVKGRRFPSGSAGRQRCVWECWSTQEDVSGLEQWAELFGADYQALLVFAYQLLPAVTLVDDTEDLWTWNGRRYLLRAVEVSEYRRHMRVRSPSWGTVSLPGAVFRELVRPFHHFSHAPQPVTEECPF